MKVSLALLAGCGGASSAGPRAANPPSATGSSTDAATSGSSTATSSSSSTSREAPSVEAEARALLDELVAVDTSHGAETKALEPIAERFRAAGVGVEIVESAPGRGNLVARLKGDGSKRPLLLLAHVDVVPVDGQPWTVPPFRATEKDGFVWGRGVGDDKGMAAAIVAITLDLARRKVPLARDVVVALTAGEETGGGAGVRWLVEHRRDLLDAEIALNEGGGLVLDDALGKVESVSLGTAEKGIQSYHLKVVGKGGHSSVPPTDLDPTLVLGRALVKIAEYKFPARVLPHVKEGLRASAAFEAPPLAAALRNAASTAPALSAADEAVLAKDRVYNALVRTTCVTTMLQGSPQDNVLPTSVEATVNCRILPDETREQTKSTLERVVGDPRVVVAFEKDVGVGPASPLTGEGPEAIARVTARTWPGVAVVPSMGTGATDSRHLRNVGIASYGLSATPTSRAEGRNGHGAHGADERRPTRWLAEGVRFLRDVTLELAARR